MSRLRFTSHLQMKCRCGIHIYVVPVWYCTSTPYWYGTRPYCSLRYSTPYQYLSPTYTAISVFVIISVISTSIATSSCIEALKPLPPFSDNRLQGFTYAPLRVAVERVRRALNSARRHGRARDGARGTGTRVHVLYSSACTGIPYYTVQLVRGTVP